MKNKNNKGFTLIEIIGTIVIIAIISIIVVPIVINSLETSKNKTKDITIMSIKNAGSSYSKEFSENINWKLDEFDNKLACINIDSLIDKGYIKESESITEIKDDKIIQASEKNGNLDIEVVDTNKCNAGKTEIPPNPNMTEIKNITLTPSFHTITVNVETEDNTKINKYFYRIGSGGFQESKNPTYTFSDLTVNTTYKIYVYVINDVNVKSFTIDKGTKTLLPKSTLVINPNGGTWNGQTGNQTITKNYKETQNIPLPYRSGYTFNRWTLGNTSGQANGTMSNLYYYGTYTYGIKDSQTDTLTANWSINSSTLVINPNGGTWNGQAGNQSITKNYGQTQSIPIPYKTEYYFGGWQKAIYNGTINTISGPATYTYGPQKNATDTLTATWNHYVARIGSNYYVTLQDALNNVPANNARTDIYLLENTSGNFTNHGSRYAVVNIQGYTITGSFTNNGTLILSGAGNINNGSTVVTNNSANLYIDGPSIYSSDYIGVVNASNGTVNMNSGSINTKIYGIYNSTTGIINLNGGSVYSASEVGILNNGYGTININGGTVSSTNWYGIYNHTGGAVNINSGTAYSENSVALFNNSNGLVTVNNGTVSSNHSHGILNYQTGTVNINNGNIYSANSVAIYNRYTGTVNIGNGTISTPNGHAIFNEQTGTININGGTIYSINNVSMYNYGNGITNLNNGQIVSEYHYAVYNHQNGTFNMNGGSIRSNYGTGNNFGIVNNSSGAVNINYGTIYSGYIGVYSNSSYKVRIGLSEVGLSTTNPSVSGGSYGVYMNNASHYFYFYSGVIKGTINYPYRGNYSSRSYHYVSSNYNGGLYNATLYYSPPSCCSGGSSGGGSVPQDTCTGSSCHPSLVEWG